jgi:D-aminoacyl-tRNA deacylase
VRLVIQRILSGTISVEGKVIAQTQQSLAVFVGIEKDDTETDIELSAKKIDGLRVFEDDAGKMSLKLPEHLPLLIVPQFTLLGSIQKGFRPDFTQAEHPDFARTKYEKLLQLLSHNYQRKIESGQFAADMKVTLIIDGPVTLIYDTRRTL